MYQLIVGISSYFLLILMMFGRQSNSARVLFLSTYAKSPYFVQEAIAEEMVNRGHEVVILVPEFESTFAKSNPLAIIYPTESIGIENTNMNVDLPEYAGYTTISQETLEILLKNCKCLLKSTKLLRRFEEFDIIVGATDFPCASILATNLKLPLVSVMMSRMNLDFHRLVGHFSPLSYIPQFKSALPNKMYFHQRVMNIFQWFYQRLLWKMNMYDPHSILIKKYNISDKSYEELMSNTKMVLAQCDFAVELAEPVTPGIKMVGPILPHPPKPLSSELEVFMSQAKKGVVIVSFGSAEDVVRHYEVQEKIVHALNRLPYRVVWKTVLNGTHTIEENVKLLSWLPQNDLLGHPNTKAFVSHAGHNGMYEAAYHGVPVVTCPLWYDQFDNSLRLVERGMALEIDIRKDSADQLYEAVMEITGDLKYRQSAQHVSRALRTRVRTPRQEAADWIEHVLTVKDMSHLKPHGSSMPAYQYYLVDVFAFIFVVVIFIVFILCFILKCLVSAARIVIRRALKLQKFKTK